MDCVELFGETVGSVTDGMDMKTIQKKKFVNASMKCDFDIDVFYNRVVIDAKSILGVMSLDLTQILTVEYMGEDAEYEAFLDTMEANNVTAA